MFHRISRVQRLIIETPVLCIFHESDSLPMNGSTWSAVTSQDGATCLWEEAEVNKRRGFQELLPTDRLVILPVGQLTLYHNP